MSKSAADTKTPDAPPAYFLSLTVENFRCFKQSVTLDLSDGNGKPAMWNVLLGENGVGKTTLLQALSFCDVYTKSEPYADGKVVHFGAIRVRSVGSDFFDAFFNNNDEWKDIPKQLLSILQVGGGSSFPFGLEMKKSGWMVDYTPSINVINSMNLYRIAYGATRRMSKRTFSETASADPCASLFDDTVQLINAEEWLLQANYAAQTATEAAKKRAEKRLAQVIDLLCGILPEGGVTDIRFTLDESTAVMTPRVEAHTPFGWVRLRDLSLGYQAALTWMVDLAARLLERYPNSANPLVEPAIVLVDEIDLHLHPKWQRELITKLRTTFPRTQFIVTAHSPLIVQAAPDANIALLKRVGDHVEIENDVDHVQNWRVDQILTSDVFGLESARPAYLDEAFRERESILTKPTLSEADWQRLNELARIIGETPDGERTGDIEAQNILRRAAQLLRGK